MSLKDAIYNFVLLKFDSIKKEFEDISIEAKKALIKLSRGNRKVYSIYKENHLSQTKGKAIYKELFDKNIIKKELSREKPLKLHPKQKLKKELRDYVIEDKIKFCKNFHRFWFTFIEPNIWDLEAKNYEKVSNIISKEFEKFVSFEFENLSERLIAKIFYQTENFGSFWTKDVEIDLLFKTKDDLLIAGEVKWKTHQVCKNILTILQKKCEREGLKIDFFALFSKSGFSKKLHNIKNEKVLLFELKDFKILYM